MREVMRREVLWREVVPLAVFAAIVALVFIVALINDEDLAEVDLALTWTMRAVGAIVAVAATFGLFWRSLNGDPLDLQFGYVLALLAGLLLIGVHWSLAVALGAIGVALIAREVITRSYPAARSADVGYSTPVDRPLT